MREESLSSNFSGNRDSQSHPCNLEGVSEDIEISGSEDEEDGAVVLALESGMPGLGDPHRVVLDGGVALHRREDCDDKLVRGVPLELCELGVERRSRLRADKGRVVVEVRPRGRGDDLRRADAERAEGEDREAYAAQAHGFEGAALLKSNCTFGGVSDPAVAVK